MRVHNLAMQIIVKDKDNKIIVDQPAESFLRGFIEMLYSSFRFVSAHKGWAKNTAGTFKAPNANTNIYDEWNTNGRMVVGTGTTPVTLEDYKLDTQIASGTGAGQLLYGGTSYVPIVSNSGEEYFDNTRIFTNSSGSDITINEIGLQINDRENNVFQIERSLVSFVVPNGGIATLTYRFKITT